jgi:Papain-like cysteine protease AvrRpt2
MNDMLYDVSLIPQHDMLSCWVGSMAMLLSFRRQASYPPSTWPTTSA